MKSLAFAAAAALLAFGCAAPNETDEGAENEPAEEAADEVIGVTDLTAMEAQLGLKKDRRDAQGRWGRGDSRLKGGDCYKQTVARSAAKWEFRRYANGAAFFRKLGTAPETNDFRPVTCVDVDVKEDGRTVTNALSGIVLDAVLRYKLGAGWRSDGAAGHLYLGFDRGAVEVADADRYCGFRFGGVDEPASDPALLTGQATMRSCLASASEDTCYARGLAACKRAATEDIKLNTLSRPSNDGQYVYGIVANGASIDARLAELAYRYAWKKAQKRDVFTEADDAVGTFVRLEQAPSIPVLGTPGFVVVPPVVEHARFSKLDLHRVVLPQPGGTSLEQLYITPKGSDDALPTRAVVQCFRAVVPNSPSADFACTGL
jgi:hypothetical protein